MQRTTDGDYDVDELVVEGIPAKLRELDRWVCWRQVGDEKKPVNARTGRVINAKTPRNWSTFEEAVASCCTRKLDGVGIALGDGLAGVDLDDCRDPETGELEGWAKEIVEALDSYTEISPSGTGVKVFVFGELPPGLREKKGPKEIYSRNKFFAVTGRHLPGTTTTVESRQEALEALHERIFGKVDDRPIVAEVVLHDRPDDEIIKRASAAKNGRDFRRLWDGDSSGYATPSEADMALCGYLAFWTGNDPDRLVRLFRRSGLAGRDKAGRDDHVRRTAEQAIAGKSGFYEGTTNSADKGLSGSIRVLSRSTKFSEKHINSERLPGVGGGDPETCRPRDDVPRDEPRQGGQGEGIGVDLALDLARKHGQVPGWRRPFDLARSLRTISLDDPYQFEDAVRAYADEAGVDFGGMLFDFLAVWDDVQTSEGYDPLGWASAEADREPYRPTWCPTPAYGKLVSIAYHLSQLQGDKPISLPQVRLAELVGTSQKTVSSMIKEMIKRGMILCVDDRFDSRSGLAKSYVWTGGVLAEAA